MDSRDVANKGNVNEDVNEETVKAIAEMVAFLDAPDREDVSPSLPVSSTSFFAKTPPNKPVSLDKKRRCCF